MARPYTLDDDIELVARFERGERDREIAPAMGRTLRSVRERRLALGLKWGEKYGGRPRADADPALLERLAGYIAAGMTDTEAAAELGVHRHTVRKLRREYFGGAPAGVPADPAHEARIRLYRERVAAGLPIFDGEG